MLALQFATATANLASQNAFLFLATHGPIFIASSSSATLIQCGFCTGVLEEGGSAPTVGAADGDCRSGCRLPRVRVDRQPIFDQARTAVQPAQQSEVRDCDSWPVQANTSSARQI
jgi:hypothetical protein